MNAPSPSVPPGVPSLLKLSQVARVLGWEDRPTRYQLETGELPSIQPRPGCARRVRAADLAAYADRLGVPLDWEAAV